MPDNQNIIPRATPLKPRKKGILVGASGGIGAALARRLTREGYDLALLDLSKESLEALCDEINQAYRETRAIPYEHNVSDYK